MRIQNERYYMNIQQMMNLKKNAMERIECSVTNIIIIVILFICICWMYYQYKCTINGDDTKII